MSAAPSVDPAGQVAPATPVLGADAAHTLFERHAGPIYGYCLNRLGGREEAEDAVQTTFLNAFRALRRGVVPEYEAAWLYKIAENVCLERNRSARRRLEVVQDPTALEETAPAATQSGRDELLGLDDALAKMPTRQRRALLLREWKGLSYREIGQELRLSQGAVETLLFRARRSLARNLQVGSLVPWLKTLLGGSAAVKTAAAASVVVAGASLGGGAPLEPQSPPAVQKRPAASAPRPATATGVMTPGGTAAAGQAPAPTGRSRGAEPARGQGVSTTPSARRSAPRPAGTSAPPQPGAPAAPSDDGVTPPPPANTPPPAPTSPAAGPPPPASPLPAVPPASLPPAPPPPTLPQLPALPGLPPPPPLPPAPQLPAPELPALPQLPLLPPPPPLPELPKLPQLP